MEPLSRKQFLQIMSTTSAAATLATITGCGDDDSPAQALLDSGVSPGSDPVGEESARGGSSSVPGTDPRPEGEQGGRAARTDGGIDGGSAREPGDAGDAGALKDASSSAQHDAGADSGHPAADSGHPGADSGRGNADSGQGGADGGQGGADSGQGGSTGIQTCSTVSITGHAHSVTIPPEDVRAGAAKEYLLTDSGHTHDLAISAAQMTQLQQGMSLTVTATRGHTHDVTIQCG